jgi:hypothetical protein
VGSNPTLSISLSLDPRLVPAAIPTAARCSGRQPAEIGRRSADGQAREQFIPPSIKESHAGNATIRMTPPDYDAGVDAVVALGHQVVSGG